MIIACPSTYGVLVCRDLQTPPAIRPPHVRLHSARLWNGELVRWGDGCDETCTADCGWCKGRLRRDRAAAADTQATPPGQASQHEALVAESEARGECWASGYPIGVCKGTVCDCFDYPLVAAASYDEIEAVLGSGSEQSS